MNNLMTVPLIRDVFLTYLRRDWTSLSNDYSVTELIDAPRPVQLRKRHKKELFEMPITDEEIRSSTKAFIGNAIHDKFASCLRDFVRRYPNSGWMFERKIWDKIAGRKVVGKFDAYRNGMLLDLKTTSVWKYIYKQFKDFEDQLNIYAELLRGDGIKVSMLQVIMWFTDYDINKTYQSVDYPPDFIQPVTVSNLWTSSVAKEKLVSLVESHKANENVSDDDLSPCTNEDFWAKPDSFAVQVPGAARAVRLLDTEAEAKAYIAASKNKDKGSWEVCKRPGSRTRCEKFCKVNVFCNQYKQYMAEKGESV